jgi:DNA polymerase-3 subunit delta
LFGAERFLKQQALKALCTAVLGAEDEELGLTRFPGKTAELAQVVDELLTVSMWGEQRLVLVEDAEDFVKNYRSGLEKYLERPAKKSVLILDVKTWAATTRLAKKVAEIGLPIDCAAPKSAEFPKWLAEQCAAAHGKQLSREAAVTLVELAGTDLGLLDQELAKLAAYVGDKPRIEPQAVRDLVGGWKAETTWSMLDAVRDGKVDAALHLLDKLLTAGEHPLKLLGGINNQFKALAQATEIARHGKPLRDAMLEAGVKPFTLDSSANYLRRIGRPRAEQLMNWLLTADCDLKGGSQLPERVIMEKLLLQLAGKL